jgi:G3E family GTPase
LRSKGFCWLAPTRWSSSKGDAWRHDTAMYWSHAGKHFGITTAGKWWGTLDSERLKQYFSNNPKEYDRIIREDWLSPEFGDRRQELVFIGVQLDEKDIRETLNHCLCTEEEMTTYRRQLRNFLDTTLTVSSSSGPSLFDVGGVGHVE